MNAGETDVYGLQPMGAQCQVHSQSIGNGKNVPLRVRIVPAARVGVAAGLLISCMRSILRERFGQV
jgi:hypothetical protein